MNIIGGGGSAEFKNGLPSFEIAIADLYPAFATSGVTAYGLDAYLEGSSVFWGYQLGASYEINDMFSVYLGARYVTATNTYNGYLKNITVDVGGVTMPASTFVENVGTQLQSTSDNIALAIAGGLLVADDAFADPTGIATLTSLGLYQPGMTNADAAYAFGMGAVGMDLKATILEDQTADIEQKGSGITPIIGVNISPNDKLNIGLKYEFQTKIELENNTTTDFIIGYDVATGNTIGMFPDGEINRNDMPALLTIGADYQMSEKFLVSTGVHYYFDKSANYGYKDAGNKIKNSEAFDNNYWEWALGLEYNISDKLLISAGYLRAQSGLKDEYQTDLNYKISSNSFGFGGAYSIAPKIDLNLAVAYTFYVEDSKDYQHDLGGSGMLIDLTETYNRDNLFFALGLDFNFGKKSE